jgi:hypothetical protein
MQKLKRFAIGVVVALLTLSVGIGVTMYLKNKLKSDNYQQHSK